MELHHVGYVVRNIERFARTLPGLEHERTVEDPLQNARLALYRVGAGSRVELVEPVSPEAYTWGWLERSGEGLHHVCYEGVSDEALDEVLRRHRLLKVRGPLPAVLLDRPVVFAVTRQRAIVEFLLP